MPGISMIRFVFLLDIGSGLAASSAVISSRGEMLVLRHDPFDDDDPVKNDDATKKVVMTHTKDFGPVRQHTNDSTPTAYIHIGSRDAPEKVILDTGSDKLVMKTGDTLKAMIHAIDPGLDEGTLTVNSKEIYNHEDSLTYQGHYVTDKYRNISEPAVRAVTYGSGTAICDEGTDTVMLGGIENGDKQRQLKNFSICEIEKDNLPPLHSKSGISGILGLQHMANRSLGTSLFSTLRDNGMMSAIGYCRGKGDNGTIIWGDTADEQDLHEVPVIGQMHWAMDLKGLQLTSGTAASS